ncbi:MAG: acetylxylan esterase [Myxococcales bacterium]|nr:acetylxylan esterase [Myxococcales bacterium]
MRRALPLITTRLLLAAALTQACADRAGSGGDTGAADAASDAGVDSAVDATLDAVLDAAVDAPIDVEASDPDTAGADDVDATADSLVDPADAREPDGDAADDTGGATGDADAASDPLDGSLDADSSAGDTGEPPPLFDMDLIRDTSTIDCRFENARVVTRSLETFDAWDVSFISYEVDEGVLTPIRLRGFAARPRGSAAPLPAVINVHGLGGEATLARVTGPAQLLGYFVIAMTGPGGGSDENGNRSEGRGPSWEGGYRIFDVVRDPRGSWLWSHAVGVMRAITCLDTRSDVDRTRIGVTGFSAGGIATLMTASLDDRVTAAVPLSGTGGWPESASAPRSWFHALLTEAELTTASAEWSTFTTELDPAWLVQHARAPIMMVNGTTDEFFPLVAHMRTFDAIDPAQPKRMSLAANFDHGCYAISGGESAATIEERATLRSEGAQRLWFHHFFGTNSDYAYIPESPTAAVSSAGGLTLVATHIDPGGSALRVASAKLWASVDSALTFLSADLDVGSGGDHAQVLAVPYSDAAIWFVDVEYTTRALIGPERFSLSTPVHIPAGHVPAVRDITSCLP